MSSDWIFPLISAFFLFLGIFFLPLIQYICRRRAISQQFTQFSKEIIANSPGTEAEDWEPIAMSLNSFMYENKFWKTKYFFYSGWNCRETFRTAIFEPFSLKKDDDARAKSFKDSVPYIEQALEAYFAEVDKQWRLITTEKALILNGLEDIQLPKKTHGFKLIWIIKGNFGRSLWFLFCSLVACMNISWNGNILRCLNSTKLLQCVSFLLYLVFLGSNLWSLRNKRVISLDMDPKMVYISTIINEHEIGTRGWNQVAKKMNRYLFEQKYLKDEEFFFDGIDCERFFNRNFLGLLSSKRSVDSKSRHVELWPYIREPQSSCAGEPSS